MGELYMIGTIKANKRSKNIAGVRLADIDGNKASIKDVGVQSVIKVLSSGVKVRNLEVDNGSLKGTEGSLDRYGSIYTSGNNNSKQPLVVLAKIGEAGYRYIDINGKVGNVRSNDLISYANNIGLANAKLVSKDGKEFIAGINFNIRVIDSLPVKQQQPIQKQVQKTVKSQEQAKHQEAGNSQEYIEEQKAIQKQAEGTVSVAVTVTEPLTHKQDMLIDIINSTDKIDNEVIKVFEASAISIIAGFGKSGGMGGIKGPYINRDKGSCCKCGETDNIVYRHNEAVICKYCASEMVDSKYRNDIRSLAGYLNTTIYRYLDVLNQKDVYKPNKKIEMALKTIIYYKDAINVFIQSEDTYYTNCKKCALVLVQKGIELPKYLVSAMLNIFRDKEEAARFWECYSGAGNDDFNMVLKSSGKDGDRLRVIVNETASELSDNAKQADMIELVYEVKYITSLCKARAELLKYVGADDIKAILDGVSISKLSQQELEDYSLLESIYNADNGNIHILEGDNNIIAYKSLADIKKIYGMLVELGKYIEEVVPDDSSMEIPADNQEKLNDINKEYSEVYGSNFSLRDYDKLHRAYI